MYRYTNPVIKGFNPDPSICRVGDEFFLVTSSFEYFPGVPVYKSTNLVNWHCIGHCLTRASQLCLDGCQASEGIYAPTIRYHNGRFYMVTTNVSDQGNFIVYTDDIYAEWSEPVFIEQGGIDPSLLFDDDKVYFVSNEDDKGNRGIYMCEINPVSGEKLTEIRLISRGCGGRYPEAPHVYSIDGMYYLMLAEGGTEYGHMVTIQRSTDPYGPYQPCPHNPVLSHRALESNSINCVGHADLIEDQNGQWWMVALGTRPVSYRGRVLMLHNLGRETFLAPVKWVDGWPVVGNQGTLALSMEANLPSAPIAQNMPTVDTLESLFSKHALTFIRNPVMKNYIFDLKRNEITLHGTETFLSADTLSPTFVGIRQQEFACSFQAEFTVTELAEHSKLGLTVFYNHEHHYDVFISKDSSGIYAGVRKQVYDIEAVTASRRLEKNASIILKIKADAEYYYLYCIENDQEILLDQGTTAALCTEITRRMTFTGTFVGLFAECATGTVKNIQICYS